MGRITFFEDLISKSISVWMNGVKHLKQLNLELVHEWKQARALFCCCYLIFYEPYSPILVKMTRKWLILLCQIVDKISTWHLSNFSQKFVSFLSKVCQKVVSFLSEVCQGSLSKVVSFVQFVTSWWGVKHKLTHSLNLWQASDKLNLILS